MALPIIVSIVSFFWMFNVVWSQTVLPTKVMSTNFSSPSQEMNRVVVVVVLKETKYSVVSLVNLH